MLCMGIFCYKDDPRGDKNGTHTEALSYSTMAFLLTVQQCCDIIVTNINRNLAKEDDSVEYEVFNTSEKHKDNFYRDDIEE